MVASPDVGSTAAPAPDPDGGTRDAKKPGVAAVILSALLALPLVTVVQPLITRPLVAGSGTAVVVLQSVVVVYAAVRLAMLAYHGEPRWMRVIFWGFTYVWIGIAGLAQVIADSNPLLTRIPEDIALTQVIVILLGMIVFDVVAQLSKRSVAPHRPPRQLVPGRVYALSVLCVVSAPPLFLFLGGPSTFFRNRQSVNDQLTQSGLISGATNATGGSILTFSNVFSFVALLALLALVKADRRRLGRPPFVFLLAGVVITNILFNNPLSNARYWFFTVALGLLFYWVGVRRRAMVPVVIVSFVVGALLLFPFLNIFRYAAGSQLKGALPDVLLTTTDYGAVTDVGLIVRYVSRHGTTDGRQIAGTLLFFVPRNVWPDKAQNTYTLIAQDTNFPYSNLDSPLWAEGYVDFGLVGALGYLGFLGFVVGRGESVYLFRRAEGATMSLAVVMLPAVAAYLPILLRGSLLQAMSRLVTMLLLLLLLSAGSRRRRTGGEPALSPSPETLAAGDG